MNRTKQISASDIAEHHGFFIIGSLWIQPVRPGSGLEMQLEKEK
jgi:hypothetical protein